ncbi:glycosyltransferase [Planotetraspora kaengkrachanensis]|uniref:Glycosyl transferase n=1 Tax=Planotetraspora kaengkrachanensis TaxID=575193 RepID=A0A8J3PNT0_9ACTN|nr:glycosyltransferase [Planotetraspora kaengkrachanensis]GIG76891.1 glycosyl transferase [Planotetraspora kaengkrachanensis]
MDIAIVSAHELTLDTPAIARELARGHRVTVYTRSRAKGAGVEHVPAGPDVELSESDLLPYISDFSNGLRRRWSKSRPDIIHAHSWSSGLAAIAGSEGLGVPVTQTFHGPGGSGTPATVRRLECAIGRRARAVIAACADEESELIRMGVPRRNISVVPHGVDTQRFRRQGPAFPRGNRPRLLHVGHCGADSAVHALAAVPDAELVIAGGDDPSVESLRVLARESGVADRVELLGVVPHTAMPKLMRSADLILSLPSTVPTGTAALEAMACGIPVIASAAGAHLDSVVDGVTGFLIRPDHPAEVAGRIRQLLGDPTLRTAIGYAASDRARSRYSVERISMELLRVYERTCA